MKKIFAVLLLATVTLLMLSGCACEHEWTQASCASPKVCTKCEETEGAPLGHSWLAATCSAPKTCEICGEVQGEALPHTFADATCTTPKACSVCGETEGEPLPHEYADATCAAARTCKTCGATEGEALPHQWEDATYSAPKTCPVCGVTEGEALIRTDLGMTKDELAQALNTALSLIGYRLEYWGDDDEGWPIYDIVTADSGSYSNVYISFWPMEESDKVYGMYICAEDANDSNAVGVLGAVGSISLLGIEKDFDTDLLQKTLQSEPAVVDGVAYYIMDSCSLTMEMQVNSEYVLFWIYPTE